MRKILIATHGYLADGVKSSIEILCGAKNNISYINAYVDDTNIDEKIEVFFKDLKGEDEAVIFTDIFGGSVNQKFIPHCTKPNVHIIAGFNLAIILEIIFKDKPLSKDNIKEEIENCRNQLIYVNDISSKEENEEGFF